MRRVAFSHRKYVRNFSSSKMFWFGQISNVSEIFSPVLVDCKNVDRKMQGVSKSQVAANPWHEEEEKKDRN